MFDEAEMTTYGHAYISYTLLQCVFYIEYYILDMSISITRIDYEWKMKFVHIFNHSDKGNILNVICLFFPSYGAPKNAENSTHIKFLVDET